MDEDTVAVAVNDGCGEQCLFVFLRKTGKRKASESREQRRKVNCFFQHGVLSTLWLYLLNVMYVGFIFPYLYSF